MADHFQFDPWKSIKADSGTWYKAIQLLGVGGNAATFLALCTSGPRKGLFFAIKVFRKLSKPERKQSFLEEAKYLRTCDHPSIMRLFDEGTYYDHNPFIVLEYLPKTLTDVMRGGCRIIDKISYAMQLTSAIGYLSGQEPPVVHRDIKPGNIFIKGDACVLGDFGLMKRLDHTGEEDKSILKESIGAGMPYYYRTPDLVDYLLGKAALSSKTDVFQLGLVLAHLFTGRNPHIAKEDFTAPIELEHLGTIPGEFGASIAGLIRRMLILDPSKRPAASELEDGWQGVFHDSVELARKLEGRVF